VTSIRRYPHVSPEINSDNLASMYLALSPEGQRQLVNFVGAGRLARIFARVPLDLKHAIASTMSSSHSEIFLEPFMAVPLGQDERDTAVLFAHLLHALSPREDVSS